MEEGMREKYESLALADLRAIAKNRGIKGTSGLKKAQSWKKKQEKRIERKTVCTVGYLSGLVRL